MDFVERYELIFNLSARCRSLALALCRAQREYGDFFLKTLLGKTSAQVFWLHGALERKIDLLGPLIARQLESAVPPTLKSVNLQDFQSELRVIRKALRKLRIAAANHVDTDLEFLAREASRRIQHCKKELRLWVVDGPTPIDELSASNGLLRDCIVYHQVDSTHRSVRLRDKDLRNDSVRALYLSANAYLELAAIDIVSDLILLVDVTRPEDFRLLMADLARQLVDEVRHAELLANRVTEMGFEFGCAPITLHSWRAYNSVETLHEKLAMQHVLQEGVGLDASAQNVKRLRDIGDLETAGLYAQIVADEMNHVRLGTRWLSKMMGPRMWDVVASVESVAKQIDPLPSIPVATELRLACGFTSQYVSKGQVTHGTQPLKDYLPQWSSGR